MKNWAWCAVLGLALTACLVGCEPPGSANGKFTFKNQSSFTVTVTPNGQTDWAKFVLGAGQSRDVEIDEDMIYFLYSPSNRVLADTSDESEIVFYNR
jgi:hypothetical protein